VQSYHAEHFDVQNQKAIKLPQKVLAFVAGETGWFGGEVVLRVGNVLLGFHN
jgi:hypothetical protein